MSKIPKCENCGKVINPEEDLVYSSMMCNECAKKHIRVKECTGWKLQDKNSKQEPRCVAELETNGEQSR